MIAPVWARERARLVAVRAGAALADRYARGRLRDDMVGARNEVVAATGRTLVPGHVEPRAHPGDLVMLAALLRHVLPPGTAPPRS